MTERRVLILLLLCTAAAAWYIWGYRGAAGDKPASPQKAEAEERAKANPFPQP